MALLSPTDEEGLMFHHSPLVPQRPLRLLRDISEDLWLNGDGGATLYFRVNSGDRVHR